MLKTYQQDALIKVSLSDKVYNVDDTIAGNIEVRSIQGARFANLNLLLQLSQNNKVIDQTQINTGDEGQEGFTFLIPNNLPNKPLFLKATIVNSGLNSQISISIPSKQAAPSIQFFPESGVAIENTNNLIAFKAVDVNGNPFDFIADILNKNNLSLKKISSSYMGMGKFNLKYTTKDSLYCKIIKPAGYDHKYYLPIPKKNTYSFNIDNKYKNRLFVKLNVDKNAKDSIFKIILSVRNKTFLNKTININATDSLSIDTHRFPIGIAQMDLCSSEGTPLAERIVFINKSNKVAHKVSGLKKQYGSKEKVHFLMNLNDRQLEDDPLNMSLSVRLIPSNFSPKNENNILSALLLQKDLIGNIPTPGFYFTDHPLADEALDLLMLTHGWRKIIRKDSIKADSWQVKDMEADIAIEGLVVKPNGKPVKQAEVLLINYKTFSLTKTITNKEGRFTFSATDYLMVAEMDSIGITATGPNNNKKVKIILNYPIYDKVSNKLNEHFQKIKLTNYSIKNTNPIINNLQQDSIKLTTVSSSSSINKGDIKIKDVDVKAKRISIIPKEIYEKKYMTKELKEKDIQFSVTATHSETLFLGLLQKAAGTFIYLEDQGLVLFRGFNSIIGKQNGAAIVVDGIFIGTDLRRLDALNPLNVKSIKVTKTAAAGLRYTPFAAGLIEVTMKNSTNTDFVQKNIKTAMNIVQITGFHPKKEFYSPIYSQKEKQNKLDLRKTILWKPNITPDKNGLSDIKFYTSDIPGQYLINFEGVSKKGRIFYLVNKFQVN